MKNALLLFSLVCFIGYSKAQLPQLELFQIASGLDSPIDIKSCGDGRLFIVEQGGLIKIMDKSGNVDTTPFLDIRNEIDVSGNEQGLLTVAFSPNYKQDSSFYVNYISGTGAGNTVISRFHVSADSNVADPGSEKVLLTFPQPFTNHNGSTLMFGPDGYLYDTQGDGGDEGDPDGNGQKKNTYLAKILRLDVSNQDTTYIIPPSNPFYDSTGYYHEIWAYGVRNPWRCSFDKLTGDMWIGDVGQNLWEEADFQPANSGGGQNYGWNCYEGDHPYNVNCGTTSGFTFPVFNYSHSTTNGCCIIGGYVYRGAQFSNLFGRYLFTDYCSGRFVDLRQIDSGVFVADTLQSFLTNQYCSFGQDNNGELYVSGRANGNIYHLMDTSNCLPVAYILPGNLTACNQVTLNALYGDSLSFAWYNTNGPLGATGNQYMASSPGWYKVKVSKLQAGCENFSDSVYVNVYYPDTLVPCNNCPVSICVQDSSFSLAKWFSPIGGLYTGPGVTNDSVFTPSVAGAGFDTILYTYTDSSGCISTATINFQVGDRTSLIDSITTVSYCSNDNPVSLSPYVSPIGGIYTGMGVIDDSIFEPKAAGTGFDTILYTYNNSFGCISVDTLNFQINGFTPLIDSATMVSYCADDEPVSLSLLVMPAGGIYSGPGIVDDSIFGPALANPGTDTILYTYVNSSNCISIDTLNFQVNGQTHLVDSVPGITYCVTDTPIQLAGFILPLGGVYSGTAVVNNFFNPTIGAEHDTIYYQYTNNYGCVSEDTFSLVVTQCTGISNVTGGFQINIFPNPNGGSFNIELHSDAIQEVHLSIIDALGRVCFNSDFMNGVPLQTIPVEVPGLSKGVYILKLKGKSASIEKQLIIE